MDEHDEPDDDGSAVGLRSASDHPGPPGWLRRLPPAIHPALLLDRRAMVGLGLLLLLAVGYGIQHFWIGRPQPVAIPVASERLSSETSGPTTPAGVAAPGPGPSPPVAHRETGQSTAGSMVVVDVAGKVQSPGLHTLPAGSRVADAVRAAGGPLAGTDTDSLNLARLLADGEQILVGAPAVPAAVPSRASSVSLNRASAEQLDALPGVGPALAQRIVLYRQDHGPFRSLDQLRRVSGVGERKFEDLRPFLTL